MKKIAIIYGLISGAIVSGSMAVSMILFGCHDSNTQASEVIGYTSMILSFSLIFVAVKIFRDKHNGGEVTFGKAFFIGLYISLIASTMYVAVWAIEYKYVFPDFMEKYATNVINEIKSSGASQAKMDAKVKEMAMYRDMYKNPLFFTLLTYMEIFPVGIIVSLICALILKRKKKETLVIS